MQKIIGVTDLQRRFRTVLDEVAGRHVFPRTSSLAEADPRPRWSRTRTSSGSRSSRSGRSSATSIAAEPAWPAATVGWRTRRWRRTCAGRGLDLHPPVRVDKTLHGALHGTRSTISIRRFRRTREGPKPTPPGSGGHRVRNTFRRVGTWIASRRFMPPPLVPYGRGSPRSGGVPRRERRGGSGRALGAAPGDRRAR